MAQMIPNTLKGISKCNSTVTPGEVIVFNYLSHLDKDCYVWFDLGISNIEVYPDFIILVPDRGILVLEVKDWTLRSIRSFNKERISLRDRSVKNPILRSRQYIELILKELSKSSYLSDRNGNLIFEWQYGVVFPNIKREDFECFEIDNTRLESVMTGKRILFSDDLSDLNSESVSTKINNFFERKGTNMSLAQFYTIKRTICPETQIEDKRIVVKHTEGKVHLDAILDNPQEMVAKSIGEGKRLLHGIAGSGKTLVMLFRAKLITLMHSDWKVLLLCWNIALKKYLEKMFDSINIQGDFSNVEINTFTQFFREKYSKYTSDSLPKLAELDEEDMDTVLTDSIDEFLTNVRLTDRDKYQAIFIDEAQDFKGEYFLFIKEFLDTKTNSMLVCADEAQNIMNRHWSFSDMEVLNFSDYINLEDNYSLTKNYRNTVEILTFAANIFDKTLPIRKSDNSICEERRIRASNLHGSIPILYGFKSWDDQYHSVANWIINLIEESDDMNFGDILVVFPGNKHKKYFLIESIFDSYKIPFYSMAKDIRSKISLDVTKNEVRISTIASSKGMDFKAVALVNAEESLNEYEDMRSILYTAVTRAREKLYIAVHEHSPVCDFLFSVYKKSFKQPKEFEQTR